MPHEQLPQPTDPKPADIFGFTEKEQLYWRVNQDRFQEILTDELTAIHKVELSNNDFGEYLFVTTSRPARAGRIAMTFYGLGFHEQRERWITDEWFWYQANVEEGKAGQRIEKEKAQEIITLRRAEIAPYLNQAEQTDRGKFFELLADLTDEDGALAEIEDLDALSIWIFAEPVPQIPRTTELLDQEIREKLSPLYSGEEKGLEALAQVKYFTPDSNWTWYGSEFDGEDTFFGLVSGFEVELGYFSLKELEEARGPLGLPIERDLHFEPKSLNELMEWHKNQNN